MQELSILFLFEELLNENPNQAIKFLKDNGIDPAINPKGKEILDQILTITGGDGFTYLLTKFHIKDRLTIDEIRRLHDVLKTQKNLLTRLPKPIVDYETYRELHDAFSELKNKMAINWLLKQLSPELQEAAQSLNRGERYQLEKTSNEFRMLKPEKQRFFMKKVFGYKDFPTFLQNIKKYIKEVNSEQDYETTKAKILSTPDAHLVYDNPEKNILIAHINSFDAMKTLGCTSAWCISRDMVRYRQYKAGGNQYFMIWDYNYPIDNSNFFIATAYNSNSPSLSATHEHIDDGRLNLIDVLKSKDISDGIFVNYIEKFKEKLRTEYASSNIFVKSLQEQDGDTIIEFLENSEYLKQYDADPYFDGRWGSKKIDLGIKSNNLIELLELGNEFESIRSLSQYSNNDYYDSSEAEYMHGGLNSSNIELLKDLARKIGLSEKEYGDFAEREGKIREFLDRYDFDNLIDVYNSEYSDAQANAEQNAAKELVDKIPFDVDETNFSMEDMFNYYIENNLTATNFDELIDQIKEKLPEISWEAISESRYVDLDLDELNRRFKEEVESIIDDVENDEDNPHYERAKAIAESIEYLKKLGFKIINKSQNFARLNTKVGTIIINEISSERQDDDSLRIMITATVSYTESKKSRNIKIPLFSIGKYINQLELPFEQLKRIKSLLK